MKEKDSIIKKLPFQYRKELNFATKIIISTFKKSLLTIILGGSAGKNNVILGWSDLDLYIIVEKYDFNLIEEMYNNLKHSKLHIGITIYSLEEVIKEKIDSKTKVMLYEKKYYLFNPTIYGKNIFENIKINYIDIKNNDYLMLPNILHEFKRMYILAILNDKLEKRKYIKKLYSLIKIFLNTKGCFVYGYVNSFKRIISLIEKESTINIDFDIMEVINNPLELERKRILTFSKVIIEFIIKESGKMENKKRISARGIILEGDNLYTMFRRKKKENGKTKEYYVIPGGGVDEGEDFEKAVLRELKEEFSIDAEIEEYLGVKETGDTVEHFFKCRIINGTPKLGGEELERCSEENYYEIRKVSIKDLDNIDILATDMIMKAYKTQNN